MEKKIVITPSKDKPIVLIILAALFFTIAIFFVFKSFANIEFSLEESVIEERIGMLELIAIFAFGGISFSQKRTLFFDLKKEKFKSQLSVGPFKIGEWQDLPSLNYISVLGIDSKYKFTLNLWYDRNKYIDIFTIRGKEKAFRTAFEIADQLNIYVLDATRRNDYRRLNMEELRKKYKSQA